MKSLRITLLIAGSIAATLLVGCAGGPVQPYPPYTKDKSELQTLFYPDLNNEANAELGQTLISKRFIQSIPAIKITDTISHVASHNGIDISIKVQPGILTKFGEGERGTYYKADSFTASITVLGTTRNLDTSGGIVIPKNAYTTKMVYRKPDSSDIAFLSENPQEIKFIKVENKIIPHKDSFIRELIYTGISKNVISIVYREFSNDLARPAYTQELKYDLGEGNVIGYKGSRFEVVKATNTGIAYKVLKQLD